MAGIAMKKHLSDQQLSEWILGAAGTDAARHLESCSTCRREAQQLKGAIGAFRESIQAAGATYSRPWRAPAERERAGWAGSMTKRLAYAAALAGILVVSVVLLKVHRAPAPSPGTAGQDEVLVQIQNDVNETVPGALEPGELLLAGVAEAPSPSTENGVSKAGRNARR